MPLANHGGAQHLHTYFTELYEGTMKLFTHKKGLNPPDATEAIIAVVLGAIFFFIIFNLITLSRASTRDAVQEQQSLLTSAHVLRTYLLQPVTPELTKNKELGAQLEAEGLRIIDVIRLTSPEVQGEYGRNIKELLAEAWFGSGEVTLEYTDGSVTFGGVPSGKITAYELKIPTKKPGQTITARLRTAREPKFYG